MNPSADVCRAQQFNQAIEDLRARISEGINKESITKSKPVSDLLYKIAHFGGYCNSAPPEELPEVIGIFKSMVFDKLDPSILKVNPLLYSIMSKFLQIFPEVSSTENLGEKDKSPVVHSLLLEAAGVKKQALRELQCPPADLETIASFIENDHDVSGIDDKNVKEILKIAQQASIEELTSYCSQEIIRPEVEEGIVLSQKVVDELQGIDLSNIDNDSSIIRYPSQDKHYVFSLKAEPNFVFKFSLKNEQIEDRFKKIVFANSVCRIHNLGLLIIPRAKLFSLEKSGRKWLYLAEQKLDIDPDPWIQEQLYSNYAQSLNNAIRQLAIFICITKACDIVWRNFPVVNNSIDNLGDRKIAAVDVEEMESASVGLFGAGIYRRGLIKCLKEDQFKIVMEQAETYLPPEEWKDHAEMEIKIRKIELIKDEELDCMYRKMNIKEGHEPIHFDPGIYKGEEKEIAYTLVEELNKTITKNKTKVSKHRRRVCVNIFSDAFRKNGVLFDHETIKKVMLKMIENHSLFAIIQENHGSFELQA